MKSNLRLVLALSATLLLVTACGSLFTRTPTGTTEVVRTNYVPQLVLVTNFVTLTNTVTLTNGTTVTNFVFSQVVLTNTVQVPVVVTNNHTNYFTAVAPGVTNAIATAESIAPLIPAPYGTALQGVLALIATGLGIYARSKNKQASAAVAESLSLAAQLAVVVKGINDAAQPETKAAVAKRAEAAQNVGGAKVSESLNATIQRLT